LKKDGINRKNSSVFSAFTVAGVGKGIKLEGEKYEGFAKGDEKRRAIGLAEVLLLHSRGQKVCLCENCIGRKRGEEEKIGKGI